MTEKDIIQRLALHIGQRDYPFQMCNAFIYRSWECDYWALDTHGLAREFEIKISRGDFLNDKKKPKHSLTGANYFYYVVPKDLVKKTEIDPKYGLLYVWEDGHITTEKKPRKLHEGVFQDYKMLAEKVYWKYDNLWRKHNRPFKIQDYQAAMRIDLQEERPLDLDELSS